MGNLRQPDGRHPSGGTGARRRRRERRRRRHEGQRCGNDRSRHTATGGLRRFRYDPRSSVSGPCGSIRPWQRVADARADAQRRGNVARLNGTSADLRGPPLPDGLGLRPRPVLIPREDVELASQNASIGFRLVSRSDDECGHGVGRGLVHPGQDVSVGLKGEGNRGVAESLADHLRRDPGLQCCRRVRVSNAPTATRRAAGSSGRAAFVRRPSLRRTPRALRPCRGREPVSGFRSWSSAPTPEPVRPRPLV